VEDYELIADDDLIALSAGEAFIPIRLSDVELPPDLPPIVGPYIIGSLLGSSRYGEWREGTKHTNGEKCALRLLKKELIQSLDEGYAQVAQENLILSSLKHVNIVDFHMVSSSFSIPYHRVCARY
jgi:serine/threonine protein kinase